MSAEYLVDLAQFDRNVDVVRNTVHPAELMLVVKNDAYGHGFEPIIRRAHQRGVRWIGAFDVPGGVRVREIVGDDSRIFVWMLQGRERARLAVSARLDIGVGSRELLELVAAESDPTDPTRVHMKIDTGLHRNGIRPETWTEAMARCAELERSGRIQVVGVWSHIAEASDIDDDAARAQFDVAVSAAHDAGLRPTMRHLAASAAAFARAEFRYDMVRVGAYCYGIRPAGGPGDLQLGITPIGTLRGTVCGIGAAGGVDGAEGVRVDVGALDGLPSTLAERFTVTTPAGRGRALEIADEYLVIDSWPEAAVGDEVTIYGSGAQTATDLAEAIGTIGEEIAVRIAPTVPRRYIPHPTKFDLETARLSGKYVLE